MTTIHYRPVNTSRLWVVRGATLIHQITTADEGEALEIVARLKALGFLVTVESMIDVEIAVPLLLPYPTT